MAEGRSSTALWAIGCGVLGMVGICCVGVGGLVLFGYRQAEEQQRLVLEELERQDEAARRAEEEARQQAAEQEALARRADAEQLTLPPISLGLSPRPNRRDRASREVTATVTRAMGELGIRPGDRCTFPVQVLDADGPAGYWCRAMVECNGVRLYGQETPQARNGFFHCELYRHPSGVAGEDLETTRHDSDPMFQIDTRSGELLVADDEASFVGGPFRVEARITAVE